MTISINFQQLFQSGQFMLIHATTNITLSFSLQNNYLASFFYNTDNKTTLKDINMYIIPFNLSQGISIFFINFWRNTFGYKYGIISALLIGTLINYLMKFWLNSHTLFQMMAYRGFLFTIFNEFLMQITSEISPQNCIFLIRTINLGHTFSLAQHTSMIRYTINPGRINPNIIRKSDDETVRYYEPEIANNQTNYYFLNSFLFLILAICCFIIIPNIKPTTKPKFTLSNRNIEATTEQIKKSFLNYSLYGIQTFTSILVYWMLLNIKSFAYEICNEEQLSKIQTLTTIISSTCIFCSMHFEKKIGFKNFLVTLHVFVAGQLIIFPNISYLSVYGVALLNIWIYSLMGLLNATVKTCCISLYGVELGKDLQSVFGLILMFHGIGATSISFLLYEPLGLTRMCQLFFVMTVSCIGIVLYNDFMHHAPKKIKDEYFDKTKGKID